jgi:hypothetical protein
LAQREAQAKRLAEELALRRTEERELAERRAQELAAEEAAAKQKFNELAAHQAQEIRAMEIKVKELNISEEVAKRNAEELRNKHAQERKDLETAQGQLEKIRAEVKMAGDLAQKHTQERLQLEQRIRELAKNEMEANNRAQQLRNQQAGLIQQIQALTHAVAKDQRELQNAEYLAQRQTEEKKTIQIQSKENIQNEQEAMEKAEALAKRQEQERQQAQKRLQSAVEEEQEARQKAYELNQKSANVTVEERPATVDVYQHTRYETTEPVVKTEIQEGTEEKSGLVDKIKSLF